MANVPRNPNPSAVAKAVLRLARRAERLACAIQGKGWAGPATITREVDAALSLLARPPALAVDVGANVGDYSAALRRACPNVEIHAFEPSPTAASALVRRFEGDPAFVANAAALSDMAGSRTLYCDKPGSRKASLIKRDLDHIGMTFDETESTQSVVFETYWREVLGRRPIDFIKIDIEGFELHALKGFGAALDAVRVLQFELGGCALDTRIFLKDFWDLFEKRGFDLYRLSPFGPMLLAEYSETLEYFHTTNYFALNRAWRA